MDNFCEENDLGFTLFDEELESFVCASKQSSVCVTTLIYTIQHKVLIPNHKQ